MRFRWLGGTGLSVSVVGLGTWQLGGEWGKDFGVAETGAMLGAARDLGVNLLDTAECYGDHVSEDLIGRAIGSHRDSWVIATKFGHRFLPGGRRRDEWSAAEVVAQLERSLRALRTDRIDLYQFHSGPDDVLENDELWAALAAQQAAGKVRHLGISVGDNNTDRQLRFGATVGAQVVQTVYSRIDRQPEAALLPAAQELGWGVLAREALAGGLLSGKYAPGTRFNDPTDTRSGRDPEQIESRLQAVSELSREVPAGTSMATWALAWVLRHPATTSVIPGCKSVDQVRSNSLAAELADPGHPLAAPI